MKNQDERKLIIRNAKNTAKREGYNQIVGINENGYFFTRDYKQEFHDSTILIGKVVTRWQNGILTVQYIKN